MKLDFVKYDLYKNTFPETGKHIIGSFDDEHILVYQAYNDRIADFAVKNQYLGGNHFKEERMTWIKPGFLWMMFRSGWATKENQERILAISLKRSDFEDIVQNAVFTSFQQHLYQSREDWQKDLQNSEYRIQWDPDHTPHGDKLERRAIQLGLSGNASKRYAREYITAIEDITDFVKSQHQVLIHQGVSEILVPKEEIYQLSNNKLSERIRIVATY
jgi:hypothetical protein